MAEKFDLLKLTCLELCIQYYYPLSMFSLYQQFPVLILVESSNEYGNMTGSRMVPTEEELTLTFEKTLFSFACESKISCGFRKQD